MVAIIKRTVNGKPYYYLEQSIRKGNKIEKKSKYLGSSVPKDLENKKTRFLYEINKDTWFSQFMKIHENYVLEKDRMPRSSQAKGLSEFSIRFTYNTQKIEGSKLNLRETALLLEKGVSPNRKSLYDIKEAEMHQKLFLEIAQNKKELSLESVLHWHRKLFSSTKPDIAGKFRTYEVRISGSKFTPPLAIELDVLINEFFAWYRMRKNKLNPVELAALCHLKFVTIHPFGDGNGRISRLMMNAVLARRYFPMLDIQYKSRNSYYNALERSQVTGDESIFCKWFFRNYIRENSRYLTMG